MIHQSSLELVGGTPLLQLNNWMRLHGLKANVIAKIEALKAAKPELAEVIDAFLATKNSTKENTPAAEALIAALEKVDVKPEATRASGSRALPPPAAIAPSSRCPRR